MVHAVTDNGWEGRDARQRVSTWRQDDPIWTFRRLAISLADPG
jgi:hypothetical protein